jgi:hypothetical protein
MGSNMPQSKTRLSYYAEPNPENMSETQYRLLRNGATVGFAHTKAGVDAFLQTANNEATKTPQEKAPRSNKRSSSKGTSSKRRYVDSTNTGVFLFNMTGLVNKFAAAMAALCAAIFHAFGSELVTLMLDVLVVTLCIGLIKAGIWIVLYVFGIEIETVEANKLRRRHKRRTK